MILTHDIDLALREQTALVAKDQIFLLMDTNTERCCSKVVLQTLDIPACRRMTVEAGEQYKSMETVMQIWSWLVREGATRQSLLICLGGGVITDMGGFAAATFKRGIAHINMPTTLLGAVDAAAGGKTGVDFMGLKNEVGLFAPAKETIIYPPFFLTLDSEELLSGYAEMVKHAYISSPLEVARILNFRIEDPDADELSELVQRSFEIKNYIVDADPTEQGMRQTLNFGHTIGHALEEKYGLRHGYAVMYGLIGELYLSVKKEGLQERELSRLISWMLPYYGKPLIECKDKEELIRLMQHDKKNPSPDSIICTLLRQVGNYHLGVQVSKDELMDTLEFLGSL